MSPLRITRASRLIGSSHPHHARCGRLLAILKLTDAYGLDGELGGRIAHTTFGENATGMPYTVELGANWVQGIENKETGAVNPIWTLAQKVSPVRDHLTGQT